MNSTKSIRDVADLENVNPVQFDLKLKNSNWFGFYGESNEFDQKIGNFSDLIHPILIQKMYLQNLS